MDLLREVQQYLADEADAQRFRWKGNEYMDPNDIKIREPWRGFGALPDAYDSNGVKIGGFRGDIPLEHQAEWDAYLKKNPEAFSGKAASTFTLDSSGITVQVDPQNGDVYLIQGGRLHVVVKHGDLAQLAGIMHGASVDASVGVTAPTPHVVNGPPVRPAPAPSFSNPPNASQGPHGPYQNSAPIAPVVKDAAYDPARHNRQAQRNAESLEFAVKAERKLIDDRDRQIRRRNGQR